MNAAYVPQVGHKVRRHHWTAAQAGTVLFVGETHLFARDPVIGESLYCIGEPGDWVQVVDPAPLPDHWCNLYKSGVVAGWSSRDIADEFAGPTRIAVLHVWTDEHGEDQAEIERVES